MIGKELYENFKGDEVICGGYKGVICGYEKHKLILAVQRGVEGWTSNECCDTDVIVTHKNNPLGYWYVNRYQLSNLIK